jgi:hypothetical protein
MDNNIENESPTGNNSQRLLNRGFYRRKKGGIGPNRFGKRGLYFLVLFPITDVSGNADPGKGQ